VGSRFGAMVSHSQDTRTHTHTYTHAHVYIHICTNAYHAPRLVRCGFQRTHRPNTHQSQRSCSTQDKLSRPKETRQCPANTHTDHRCTRARPRDKSQVKSVACKRSDITNSTNLQAPHNYTPTRTEHNHTHTKTHKRHTHMFPTRQTRTCTSCDTQTHNTYSEGNPHCSCARHRPRVLSTHCPGKGCKCVEPPAEKVIVLARDAFTSQGACACRG